MASAINCDLCAVEQAMSMWTSLTDGSVIAIGPSCAPAFVTGLASSLGYVALPADVVPTTMGGTLEIDQAPKPKGRGRRAQAGTEQPEESTTDDPTDATDAATGAAQDGTPVEPEAEQVSV